MYKTVTILSFSSRKHGNCASICEHLINFHKETNINLFVIDSEICEPCGKCDYECLKPGADCPRLNRQLCSVLDTVCESEMVYFVVPNYCGHPCANYFAFNERTVGYFNMDKVKLNHYMKIRKRFIIVSNTENFEQAMQQQTSGKPDMIYMKSRKYKCSSIAGDLMECEEAKADLDKFLGMDMTGNTLL